MSMNSDWTRLRCFEVPCQMRRRSQRTHRIAFEVCTMKRLPRRIHDVVRKRGSWIGALGHQGAGGGLTIRQFRSGSRANSPGMFDLVRTFDEGDIEAIAAYLNAAQ
jgi:hypothetical protein